MTDALSVRIASLGDDDIVRVLPVDAEQYRPEALELARAEATRREPALDAGVPHSEPSERSLGRAVRAFGQAVANTRGLTFFGLDWLDRGATVLSRTRCGLLQWFRAAPSRTPR